MATTVAFDVYGTLIDTQGIVAALEAYAGARAPEFSRVWREKQLEYSFRRGLMQNYVDFATCTRHALEYTCVALSLPLRAEDQNRLMEAYRTLPAFADVAAGLARAQEAGFRLFAFSNGAAAAVEGLLQHAGLREFFRGVVSVDEVRSYKPNPAVYAHFLRRAGACGANAWLVSSNPFDVLGAMSAGMRAAWVRRSPQALFDPWESEPTVTITSLRDLVDQIEQVSREG